ncbi:cytochrome-c peroxidase [Amylibacter sp.]|nr:cytochrome-c peroxidase [Amylibacter sp.]
MRIISTVLLVMLAGPVQSEHLPSADATFSNASMDLVQIGQLLFYDPILSGNKTVSCATCHHPRYATSDGVSLGIGDGGIGLGPDRRADPQNPPEQRIPRNSPALFNLGASEFSVLFHDGRLEFDPSEPSGFRTPLGADMESGFDSLLSAQTMFPVLSPDEMAGHYSENDVAQAIRQGFFTGPNGAWDILAKRVEAIPEYREKFEHTLNTDQELHFADISNAIAAFMAFEWRADNSLFDRYLRGSAALSPAQTKGLTLFYGTAGCSNCHSGQFQTDHGFHAIAMPQIGPGKAGRFERHQKDEGRMRVTGALSDAFAFRTPSLRNVVHTGPYGHSGAFATLREILRHHTNPMTSLDTYNTNQAVLPNFDVKNDFAVMSDPEQRAAIASANSLKTSVLSPDDISNIIAFLETLTDPVSITGRLGIPKKVPSCLPVER